VCVLSAMILDFLQTFDEEEEEEEEEETHTRERERETRKNSSKFLCSELSVYVELCYY
jgi:hypothetical protein